MKDVFVSTSGFGKRDIKEIINECAEHGIHNIELSSLSHYNDDIKQFLLDCYKSRNFRFLVHNYSPPPEVPFVLNLASKDRDILDRSLEHCYNAIDLNHEFDSPFYSVHCGFSFYAEPEHLGNNLTDLPRFSLEKAEDIFIDSLRKLGDYAQTKGMKLAIENNVCAPFNLIDGQNKLLLGVTAEEIKRYISKAEQDNLRVLMDVAHLKVSAKSLGFDPYDSINSLSPYIAGFHLSDNDGNADTNSAITNESWFWGPLRDTWNEDIALILEVKNLTPTFIKEQFSIIKSCLFSDN